MMGAAHDRRPPRRRHHLDRRPLGSRPGPSRLASATCWRPAGRCRRGGRRWGGRDLPPAADGVVAAALAAAATPGLPLGVRMALAAPTILAHGPDGVRAPASSPPRSPASRRGASSSASRAPAPDLAGLTSTAEARRRRLGGQRPEGVEHERPARRRRSAAGPDRLGRPQAPGADVLRAAHAPARRRGPPAAPDERPPVLQRGVPDRGPSRPATWSARRGRAGRWR